MTFKAQSKFGKAFSRLQMIIHEFFEKGIHYSWWLAIYNTAWWIGNYCHPLVKLQFWGKMKITEWMDNPIPLEVHHLDGKELNSELNNLILLCPNCHALTDDYRGRNINSGIKNITDEEFVKALNEAPNIRQALISLGLTPKGGNYVRANELIQKYQIDKFLVGAPSEETTCVNDP